MLYEVSTSRILHSVFISGADAGDPGAYTGQDGLEYLDQPPNTAVHLMIGMDWVEPEKRT